MEKAQCGILPRDAKNTIRSKIEDELTDENQMIEKVRRMITRPGRLRARSGSNLPAARFRYGPIGTVGCEGQGACFFGFGCFAESVSVHALPLVRKGTRAGCLWVGLELNLEARPGCVVYSRGDLLKVFRPMLYR